MAKTGSAKDIFKFIQGASGAAGSLGQQRVAAEGIKERKRRTLEEELQRQLGGARDQSRIDLAKKERIDRITKDSVNFATGIATEKGYPIDGPEWKELFNLASERFGLGQTLTIEKGEKKKVTPDVRETFVEKFTEFAAGLLVEETQASAQAKEAQGSFPEARGRAELFDQPQLTSSLRPGDTGVLPIKESARGPAEGQQPFFSLKPPSAESLASAFQQKLGALPIGSAANKSREVITPPDVFLRPGSGSVRETVARKAVEAAIADATPRSIRKAEDQIASMPTGSGIGDFTEDEKASHLKTLSELKMHRFIALGESPE